MKKFDANSALGFGFIMALVYIIQNLWTADTLTSTVVFMSVISGLIGGVVAGFLFGLFTGWYKASKYNTSHKNEQGNTGND